MEAPRKIPHDQNNLGEALRKIPNDHPNLRKTHLEIYRPTNVPTAASQKARCHKLREFTRIRAKTDNNIDDQAHLRLNPT